MVPMLIHGGMSSWERLGGLQAANLKNSSGLNANGHLIGLMSGLVWIHLEFRELNREKRLSSPWTFQILCLSSFLFFLGPAPAVALGWGLREELLATSTIPAV